MKRKTMLKITREENGECSVVVRFSDADLKCHDGKAVLLELLKDASSDEFYNFVVEKPQ
jgi:hypothetical protein